MAKRYRNRVVYAKIEVTKGTDSVPTGTNAILTTNFQWSEPYAGDRISRDLDGAGLGLQEEININPHVKFSFEVEAAGAGAAGDAPAYGALLRACGFTQTIDAGIDVEYDPNSDFTDAVSVYVVIDGDLQKITGCVGSWGFNGARGIPKLVFNMVGNYAKPINDGTPLTPDFTAFEPPLPMTRANTTFTIDGYAAVLLSITMDAGIPILPRNVPNLEEVLQTDRGVTGSIVIQAPKVSQKDVFADLLHSHVGINSGALVLVHGTVAGNIFQINAPAVQLSGVQENNDSGIQTYTCSARFVPTSSGDDEVKLTVK